MDYLRRHKLFVAIVVLLIVAAIACAVVYVLNRDRIAAWLAYRSANVEYTGKAKRIYFDADLGADALHKMLRDSLGDDYGDKVYDVWYKMGGKDGGRSGSFVIHPGDKANELGRRISSGRQDPMRVTFNNARTLGIMAERVTSHLKVSPQQLLDAIADRLNADGIPVEQYPAYLHPDTYEVYWTISADDLADKLIDYDKTFWTDARLARAATIGLNPVQVATLASIVEEETNKLDEQPTVARLYLNRLDRDMLLQADPTVKFAVGDFSLKRVLTAHTLTDSPYNTYIYKGLPPGPIRIPSAAAIDAVLNAPTHDYLYMCAKEDFSGYHNFAKDYKTHQANARRYQQALNRAGIK